MTDSDSIDHNNRRSVIITYSLQSTDRSSRRSAIITYSRQSIRAEIEIESELAGDVHLNSLDHAMFYSRDAVYYQYLQNRYSKNRDSERQADPIRYRNESRRRLLTILVHGEVLMRPMNHQYNEQIREIQRYIASPNRFEGMTISLGQEPAVRRHYDGASSDTAVVYRVTIRLEEP